MCWPYQTSVRRSSASKTWLVCCSASATDTCRPSCCCERSCNTTSPRCRYDTFLTSWLIWVIAYRHSLILQSKGRIDIRLSENMQLLPLPKARQEGPVDDSAPIPRHRAYVKVASDAKQHELQMVQDRLNLTASIAIEPADSLRIVHDNSDDKKFDFERLPLADSSCPRLNHDTSLCHPQRSQNRSRSGRHPSLRHRLHTAYLSTRSILSANPKLHRQARYDIHGVR